MDLYLARKLLNLPRQYHEELKNMATCWSCTVMIAHGARVCPFCGADQLKPVAFINPDVPEKQTVKTVLHDSAAPIFVIVVCICVLGGIFWHSFGAPAH